MRLVSPSIMNQITTERDSLLKETHYIVRKRKSIYLFLREESDKHSAIIELPNGNKRIDRNAVDYAGQNLAKAHNTFCSSYRGRLDRDLIFDVWESLMPDLEPKKFRTSYDGWCRPKHSRNFYPGNVFEELDIFFKENEVLENPIERAFHVHLHLLRIHPFLDGNGRLGRVIQNSLLLNDNCPPIIIHKKDRPNYMDLIENAQISYKQNDRRKTREQTKFYNFLAMNLWSSMEKARTMVDEKTRIIKQKRR